VLTPPSRVSSPHSVTKCVRMSLSPRRLITRGDKLCTIYLHNTITFILLDGGRCITDECDECLKSERMTIACSLNPAKSRCIWVHRGDRCDLKFHSPSPYRPTAPTRTSTTVDKNIHNILY